MSLPSTDTSVVSRLRGLAADVVELVQVRAELAAVEARAEAKRVALMAVMGALALAMVSFGIIFLALFLTVMVWDTHRLLPLGIFTAFFLGGALVLALLVWMNAKKGFDMFSATRDELRRDRERLRAQ